MLLFSRLKLLFLNILIFVIVASCAADRRVDYKAHPELKSIQSSHPGPYNKMVELYSENFKDDVVLNEKVIEQANAIARVHRLMSPEISFKYDQLTEESGRDAFLIELEKLEQQIESLGQVPLIDWTQIEKNMIGYLEIRNERVRELKASMESPDTSSSKIKELIETE
jgi:hypothetical protein